MSGDQTTLVDSAGSAVDDSLRSSVRWAAAFLLEHQYVRSEYSDGLWQVVVGSGMGQNFSGELADAAFYSDVERNRVDNARWLATMGIRLYARFKDDIFMAVSTDPIIYHTCYRWLVTDNRSCFKVKLEAVSRSNVDMLDINIFKGPRYASSGRLDFRPIWKKTSLGAPLSFSSVHPSNIHLSWPVSELGRLHRHSSSATLSAQARSVFIERLGKYGVPSFYLDLLRSWSQKRSKGPPKSCSRDSHRLWIRCPFHRVWARSGVTKVCRDFFALEVAQGTSRRFLGFVPEIRLAWVLPQAPLVQAVARASKSK